MWKIRATKAGGSAHNRILLRPLSELSAQCPWYLCTGVSKHKQKSSKPAMRLRTNLNDGNECFAEDEGRKNHGAENTLMIGSLRSVTNNADVKAFLSMEDAWKTAFSDRWARVDPQYKKTYPKLEVLQNSALTLECQDAGLVKTWVRLPPSHPNWQEVSFREPEWTVLMEIIARQLREIDCMVMQQMAQARARKKTRRDGEVRREVGGKGRSCRRRAMKNENSRWKLNRRSLAHRMRANQSTAKVE